MKNMKNIKIATVFVFSIVALAAFNLNLNLKKSIVKGDLVLANVEALALPESETEKVGYSMDRVAKDIKVYADVHLDLCPNKGKPISVASCGCNFKYEAKMISCCISHTYIIWGKCDFALQNKDC